MKKKLLTLLLAGIMAGGMLAGCGSTDHAGTARSESKENAPGAGSAAAGANTAEMVSAAQDTADSTEDSAASGGPIDLTMYFPVSVGGGPDALINALCEEYHKENPDVTVTPVYAGSYADTRTKVQAAIKAGNAPDLAIMFSIDLYSLRAMDAIVPMDDFCTTDEDKEWLKGFYDGFMMNSRDGETTYGIPWQRSTIILYYNKDAFREAGLDPETPPSTWQELHDDAKALTKEENGEIRWGLEIPSDEAGYAYWMLQTFCVQQNGFNLMNDTGTETYYDDPRTVKALNEWKSYAEEGSMPKGIITWATTPSDFIEGKTAMMYHTTGNLTNVRKNARFDFGVAMLPKGDSFGSPTGGGNFYIFKGASPEHQQAAFDFIKWMTDDERVAQWSIDTGYVATRPAAYETDRMKQYAAEFPSCLVARDQLEYGYAELSTYNQAEVQKAVDDAISYVMTDQQDTESALRTAQQTAQNILAPYQNQ